MNKKLILIWSLALLMLSAQHAMASLTETPQGAFWIDNYWRDIRGCQQNEPVHWRTATGCLRVIDEEGLRVDETGLASLNISGSADPSFVNMQWLQKNYGAQHPITIVDLRQETHVYVDGLPISIYYKEDQINWGKSEEEIKAAEAAWTQKLAAAGKWTINKLGKPKGGVKGPVDPIEIPVKEAMTEEQAAAKAGLGYLRIYVPDFHPPSPAQVDQFLEFIQGLPKNAWLHFHCAAGDGRTTTFMLMRDILENGSKVSLEDLALRQARLGGIYLLGPSAAVTAQPWKAEFGKARVAYLHLFYNYVTSGAYPSEKFSHWMAKQPAGPYQALLKTAAYFQAKPTE